MVREEHTATLVNSCQVSLSAFVVNQPLDKSILHWRRGAFHLYLFERAGMVARGHYTIFLDVCMVGLILVFGFRHFCRSKKVRPVNS